ncbi:MAG: FtsX-like permease family protein [Dehalococcoidia bacterium]
MDNLFGLSMTTIMIVLASIFAICLASVAYVALRNRLVFMLGLRNIPRRRAQSVLIVVGLMLASLIITASLATGDTIDRSITAAVYDGLGEVDEIVAVDIDDEAATRDQLYFSFAEFEELEAELEGNPNVDAMTPALTDTVNVYNREARLSEPTTSLAGVSVERVGAFGPYETVSGGSFDFSDLGEGQALINEELADNVDAGVGDTITIVAQGVEHDYEVGAVVKTTILGGDLQGGGPQGGGVSLSSRNGVVVPLTGAQRIVGRPGQINYILISNTGDEKSGAALTDEVITAVSPVFESDEAQVTNEIKPRISPTKLNNLEDAEEIGNIFSLIFVVFGLFSIAAGILLIFLIFVMLAAERRPEMGMARAVGMKRSHLIQQFISEGMAYDVGAAFVGTVLGVGVAFLLVTIMINLFEVDIPLEYSVSPRSLIVALCLAMSLTFITIFISSLNTSRLNIVAAIADLPQPTTRRRRGRGEIAVGFVLTLYVLGLITVPIIALTINALAGLALLLVMFVGALIPVLRRTLYRPLGLALGQHRGHVFSVMALVGGALLMLLGQSGDVLALFTMGFSLFVLGVVFFLTYLTKIPGRVLWTVASLVLLVFWLLPTDVQNTLFGELNGDFEMFFVSGVFIVIASTLFLVYNADLLLTVLTLIAGRFSSILPAVRMAVVYPLASRLRTGLTLAMFSLIMFALVVMAILNTSFLEAQSSDEAVGGWDVLVTTSPNTEISDLRGAIEAGGGSTDELADVGRVSLASLFGSEAEQVSWPSTADAEDEADTESGVVSLWAGDQEFLENNRMPLQVIAEGYADEAAVWQALAEDPTLAVVDASTITGFTNDGEEDVTFRIRGVDAGDNTMEPIEVALRNPLAGEETRVTVIGVLDETVILATGVFTSQQAVEPLYGDGDLNQFFVNTTEGADDKEVAKGIESTLVEQGVQGQSLQEILDDIQAQQEGFLYLLEGFMSLGLVVGVASLGVISLRAVVERRQQIGMLRAVGFRGSLVSLAFMLESGFIAFVGMGAGILAAFMLSYNLLNSDEISGSSQIHYVIPWGQIMLFAGLAFVASLIMTWFPARAASRVPVAEALRYE